MGSSSLQAIGKLYTTKLGIEIDVALDCLTIMQ